MNSFSSEEKAHMVNLGTGIDAKLLICNQVDNKVSVSINCFALVFYFFHHFILLARPIIKSIVRQEGEFAFFIKNNF